MIRDEHQVAGAPERIQSAARVRHEQGVGTERAQHANWKGDLLQRIPFIPMKAPLHGDHGPGT
jgi:hypothetical protein